MVRHGGSSAGSYLADPTSPIPSHCVVTILFKKCPSASIVVTSTLTVNIDDEHYESVQLQMHVFLLIINDLLVVGISHKGQCEILATEMNFPPNKFLFLTLMNT